MQSVHFFEKFKKFDETIFQMCRNEGRLKLDAIIYSSNVNNCRRKHFGFILLKRQLKDFFVVVTKIGSSFVSLKYFVDYFPE
jgi:hypothetical protein